MHELTEKIMGSEKTDQIIREWLGERVRHIEITYRAYGTPNFVEPKVILGIAEKTIDDKISDWFEESHGKYSSGSEWRLACKHAVTRIAEDHHKEKPNA